MTSARTPETVTRKRWPPNSAKLDVLIEEAIVDAYGESEQRTAFYTMIEEHLAMPFESIVFGVAVTVERLDLTNDEQIAAVCWRGRSRQLVSILEVPMPSRPPSGAEWIAAYRRWARP